MQVLSECSKDASSSDASAASVQSASELGASASETIKPQKLKGPGDSEHGFEGLKGKKGGLVEWQRIILRYVYTK